MDFQHFQRALEELRSCEEKCHAIAATSDLHVANRLWSEFLVSHQRWFTRMKQALQNGSSAAWFGKLKARRKSDVLLKYLHAARHADEHGVERVAAPNPGSILIGGGEGFRYYKNIRFKGGQLVELSVYPSTPLPNITFIEKHLKLKRVQNSGVEYDPPISPEFGEAYSAIRAARECLELMKIASNEADEFFKKLKVRGE